jgi:ribose 5-phosphate isomerase RpiB
MRIAVINEISAAAKNGDILKALEGRDHEILNLGNTSADQIPALQYIHTGLMSALLLHLNVVDFVIGGCGTGLGYMNSVLQYPGVSSGLILNPLDAWLFARINAGNCVSLALNVGYGWAGDINLGMIFDKLFTPDTGAGYPVHRAEPQKRSREILAGISNATHKSFPDILRSLSVEVTRPVFEYPAFQPVILNAAQKNPELLSVITTILK